MPIKPVALIIHAGAGLYPKNLARAERIRQNLAQFCKRGFEFLKKHPALDTVVEIVRWLEDWPETNAGTGAMLQSDGVARLSASVMDGHKQIFSGVANLERIMNPILVAALLQKEKDRVLTSKGARKFAIEKGFKSFDPRTKKSVERWQTLLKERNRGKYGTVGACALDANGYLASATSSGGKGMERVGRVSDSALPAGNFANFYAAVSATGLGEDIIDEALASTLVIRASDGKDLERSFRETFRHAKREKRRLAAIGLDRKGTICFAHTTEILYYAYLSPIDSGVFSLPKSH